MKLIVVIGTLRVGGAERVISILSGPFADSFKEVQYVLWDSNEVCYSIDPRVKIVSLTDLLNKGNRYQKILGFRRYVKKERPNLILSFLTPFNMLTLSALIGIGIPVIVSERADPKWVKGGRLMIGVRNILYLKAKCILTQTEYAKSCYKGKLNAKSKVIYNPVMMDDWMVGKALNSTKKKAFVTAGRLEPVKNQAMMIDAFRFFHESHPDYQLIIYGDGPMRNELSSHIQSVGLQYSVVLAGNVDGLWEKMSTSECFLLTSTNEGMSNAMIEAMCLGLPVVSTKVSGATDLIEDGKNGFLIDINDTSALSHRMSQLADSDSLRRSIGNQAKEVYQLLKKDIICKEWVSCLLSQIDTGG